MFLSMSSKASSGISRFVYCWLSSSSPNYTRVLVRSEGRHKVAFRILTPSIENEKGRSPYAQGPWCWTRYIGHIQTTRIVSRSPEQLPSLSSGPNPTMCRRDGHCRWRLVTGHHGPQEPLRVDGSPSEESAMLAKNDRCNPRAGDVERSGCKDSGGCTTQATLTAYWYNSVLCTCDAIAQIETHAPSASFYNKEYTMLPRVFGRRSAS
jgi:hypothetical protein